MLAGHLPFGNLAGFSYKNMLDPAAFDAFGLSLAVYRRALSKRIMLEPLPDNGYGMMREVTCLTPPGFYFELGSQYAHLIIVKKHKPIEHWRFLDDLIPGYEVIERVIMDDAETFQSRFLRITYEVEAVQLEAGIWRGHLPDEGRVA